MEQFSNAKVFAKIDGKLDSNQYIMGIDEAGRGPVIGPMVFGVAFWAAKDNNTISKLGFNDSKQLTEDIRENFFKEITEEHHNQIGYGYNTVSAKDISELMLRSSSISLNDISFLATVNLITSVITNFHISPQWLYVDAVGNTDMYRRKLEREFPDIENIVIEAKADATYKVVSAASIVAKVIRDRSMKSFGCSGYPSDPKTIQWLNENFHPFFGFPSSVRFSWKTIKSILGEDSNENAQDERFMNLKPFDVVWPEDSNDSPSIQEFFPKKRKLHGQSTQFKQRFGIYNSYNVGHTSFKTLLDD